MTLNLSFLAVDIVLAHSVNEFGHWAEWIPLAFTLTGAAVVGVGLLRGGPGGGRMPRLGGMAVGWAGIVVGIAGLLWHLESRFFEGMTLENLVYSAPFAAPLAFTGLGFLLVLNRMVRDDDREWAFWILILTLGGFVGNLALSLADHAQNGFFDPLEWAAVAVSALGVSTLTVLLAFDPPGRTFRGFVWGVLALQGVTGATGFVLHLGPLLSPSSAGWTDRIVYGPPLFAPLLFANLALLGALGLWARGRADGAGAPLPLSPGRPPPPSGG